MGLNASGLILYGSVNMPEADGLTAGGAITGNIKVVFDNADKTNVPSGKLGIVSATAGDNAQVWFYGRNAGGNLINEMVTTNGVTPVSGTLTYERLLKVAATGTGFHNYTLTVRDEQHQTVVTLESGIHSVRRPFYATSAEAAGGAAKDYYEKVFLKNTDSTYALLGAQIHETADPSTFITFALGTAQNDTETVASRLNTAPTAVSAFSSLGKSVPGTDLNAGSGISVWLKLSLAAGASAQNTTYTIQASGSSI